MYIDLIVLLILLVIVVMFFKRFSSFVFFIAIVDIFLRILAYIKHNLGNRDISNLISKYLPENMFQIIDKYTGKWDLVNTILRWGFVVIMTIFLVYITKIFLKKKKI